MKKYNQCSLTQQQCQQIRQKSLSIPKYFKRVQLTLPAASKILHHSTHGIPHEVMGLLTGFYRQHCSSFSSPQGIFTITDVIFLPVQSSQTRVTADDQTYSLIAGYTQYLHKIRSHNIIGWYHSHPSYGCWLSGIDVNTQEIFQRNNDPFIALVVDPVKSKQMEKIDVAAFRVHHKGYKDKQQYADNNNINTNIPRRKVVDFGVHYQRYYQLPIQLVTNHSSQHLLSKVSQLQWATQLSTIPLQQQQNYLIQRVKDQNQELKQLKQMKQSQIKKYEEIKNKEKEVMKKVKGYERENNVMLMDTILKVGLF